MTGIMDRSDNEKIGMIKDRIKTYPDFPKKGVMFKDVFPLAHHPSLIPTIGDLLHSRIKNLAARLKADFIPARKAGKLPGKTVGHSYQLEYGSAKLEIQEEYLVPGKVAVIVDDLIATGGTMGAVCTILKDAGLKVLECQCIVELPELKGRENLPEGCSLFCLVNFDDE